MESCKKKTFPNLANEKGTFNLLATYSLPLLRLHFEDCVFHLKTPQLTHTSPANSTSIKIYVASFSLLDLTDRHLHIFSHRTFFCFGETHPA